MQCNSLSQIKIISLMRHTPRPNNSYVTHFSKLLKLNVFKLYIQLRCFSKLLFVCDVFLFVFLLSFFHSAHCI